MVYGAAEASSNGTEAYPGIPVVRSRLEAAVLGTVNSSPYKPKCATVHAAQQLYTVFRLEEENSILDKC
eukprot:5145972-Amphidinium_carterae.1